MYVINVVSCFEKKKNEEINKEWAGETLKQTETKEKNKMWIYIYILFWKQRNLDRMKKIRKAEIPIGNHCFGIVPMSEFGCVCFSHIKDNMEKEKK